MLKLTIRFRFLLLSFFLLALSLQAFPKERELYELIVYHLKNSDQEQQVDRFLKTAFLPALHRSGLKNVGVFKPVGNDTSSDRRIFILIPYNSIDQFIKLNGQLQKDNSYLEAGKDYFNAPFDNPPYIRIEKIQLQAFTQMPRMQIPGLTGPRSERIYELRSYESATEKLHDKKVHMFNEGGEVTLFKRLGFNAVFYSKVLIGSTMPNLMYMTTFENRASRDEHWKAFGSDPEWKKLSAMPEYKNTVSKNVTLFLTPTEYSDY